MRTYAGLLQPNEAQASALLRLKSNPDWSVLCGWLEDSLKTLASNTLTDAPALWAQGHGQNIAALIGQVEGADETLQKLRTERANQANAELEKFGQEYQ